MIPIDFTPSDGTTKLNPQPIHPIETPLPEPLSEPPVSEVPTPSLLNNPENDVFQQSTPVADAVDTVKPSGTLRSSEVIPDTKVTAEAKEWVESFTAKVNEEVGKLSPAQQALFDTKMGNSYFVMIQHWDKNGQVNDLDQLKAAYEGVYKDSLAQVKETENIWQEPPTLSRFTGERRQELYETLTKDLTPTQLEYFRRQSTQAFTDLDNPLGLMHRHPSAEVEDYAFGLIENFNTKWTEFREQILDPRKFDLEQWNAELGKKYTQGFTTEQYEQLEPQLKEFSSNLMKHFSKKHEGKEPSADDLVELRQAFEDGLAEIVFSIKTPLGGRIRLNEDPADRILQRLEERNKPTPPKATTYYGGGGGGGYRKAAKADTPVEVKAPEAPDVTVPENVSKTVKEGTKTLEKEGGPVKVALAVGAGALAIGAGVWVYLQNKASQVVASTVAPTIAQGGKDPNALPSSLAPTTPAPSKIIVA
jgi:hypothetical protein